MEYVELGDTELRASRVGLGTWAIGGMMWGGTDEADGVRTIHAALEGGINLLDTAPVYGFGRSEEIVGRAVREWGNRQEVLIATKAGLDWSSGSVRRNSAPERIRREAEDSLRRLRTDYLDVLQIHWPDPAVPIADTARILAELFREGKIRAIGVSNYSPEQMDAFREAAPLHTSQPPLNVFEPGALADVIPYCREHGITPLTYSALCRGLLSGRMEPDTEFPEGDLRREGDPKFQPPRFGQYLQAVDRLDRFARENYDRRVIDLALRWLLDRMDGVALWGARRPEQLEPLDRVWGWRLDADALDTVRRIVEETVRDPVGPEWMAPPEGEGDAG